MVPAAIVDATREPHDSTGEPGAGNRHAGFGERGGNVPMGVGLRPGAKAPKAPPTPYGHAPPLDFTRMVSVPFGWGETAALLRSTAPENTNTRPGRRRESRVARSWIAVRDIEPLSVESVREPAERLVGRYLRSHVGFLGWDARPGDAPGTPRRRENVRRLRRADDAAWFDRETGEVRQDARSSWAVLLGFWLHLRRGHHPLGAPHPRTPRRARAAPSSPGQRLRPGRLRIAALRSRAARPFRPAAREPLRFRRVDDRPGEARRGRRALLLDPARACPPPARHPA